MDLQRSLFDDFENNDNVAEQSASKAQQPDTKAQQPEAKAQPTGDEARILELRETLNRHNHSY